MSTGIEEMASRGDAGAGGRIGYRETSEMREETAFKKKRIAHSNGVQRGAPVYPFFLFSHIMTPSFVWRS